MQLETKEIETKEGCLLEVLELNEQGEYIEVRFKNQGNKVKRYKVYKKKDGTIYFNYNKTRYYVSVRRIIFSNFYDNCCCKDNYDCDCAILRVEDERINLNKKADGLIIGIASLGLWNGRVSGYKIFDDNINSILFTDCDFVEWYGDGKDIKSTMCHHDGTNYITYRIIKEDKNIENLTRKLYNNDEVSDEMIEKYTKSLYPSVSEVYGW